jgi:hypothetical protein
VIRTAVRGAKGRFKVVKVVLRVAYVDGRVVERDVVGAINIGLNISTQMGALWRWARLGLMRCE